MSIRSNILAFLALLGLLLAGCDRRSPIAYGEANSIIVVADEATWSEVADEAHATLEPTIFTTRDERTFTLTHVSPSHEDWLKLRQFREVLVIGRQTDWWVEPVLASAGGTPSSLPAIVDASDVWARGQHVTALVVPEDDVAARVSEALPAVHDRYESRFQEYVRTRMYTSGVDTARAARLEREAGFSILLPEVYSEFEPNDSTYMFRNDNATSGQLLRSVLVTWRSGAREMTPEEILDWRDAVAAEAYPTGQTSARERIETRDPEHQGDRALEVQGIWQGTDPSFPLAGPFRTRVVSCPEQDRTYLLDAWLYIPGRSKYEYVLQLQTILDSFVCGTRS